MEVMNCKECKRLFNYISGPKLCPDCSKKLEEKFQQVKEYIRSHEYSSIAQVSEENDVSVNQLKQWVREERLIFDSSKGITFECESCGATILTGRFCDKCKARVTNDFRNAMPRQTSQPVRRERDRVRMRFLDK